MCFYMLNISGKSSYYTIKPASTVVTTQNILPLVPKLYNSIIMSFDQWHNKYEKEIGEMTCYVIENLFNLSSSKEYVLLEKFIVATELSFSDSIIKFLLFVEMLKSLNVVISVADILYPIELERLLMSKATTSLNTLFFRKCQLRRI